MSAESHGATSVAGKAYYPVRWLPLGVVFALAVFWIWPSHEPVYHGRTITNWLRNYPQYKQKDWRETEAALGSFGTNAIPYVMREFIRSDPPWRTLHFRIWYYGPLWIKNLVGVPRTWRFDNRYAPEVFAAIGPSSIPALADWLKSEDPKIQIAASRGLGWFGPNAKSALPNLKKCLEEARNDRFVREAISNSIVQIESETPPRQNHR